VTLYINVGNKEINLLFPTPSHCSEVHYCEELLKLRYIPEVEDNPYHLDVDPP